MMGSGYYPLERKCGAGKKLEKLADELRAMMDGRWDARYSNVPDALPMADDNDQYDNAASDGHYEAYLSLALELIERCLEKRKLDTPTDGPCV